MATGSREVGPSAIYGRGVLRQALHFTQISKTMAKNKQAYIVMKTDYDWYFLGQPPIPV